MTRKLKAKKTFDLSRASETFEYHYGREAYQDGFRFTSSPRQDERIVFWWCGYLDARTEKRIGHILKKYDGTNTSSKDDT